MKKLLKIVLPPVLLFLIFAWLVYHGPFSKHVKGLGTIGDETAYGLMAYYKIFFPLLLLTALFTQGLIVLPLWRKILNGRQGRVWVFVFVIITCIILAGSIAYLIWDKATGVNHLTGIFFFMAGVQVFYWLVDFLVLFLIDLKEFRHKPEETIVP